MKRDIHHDRELAQATITFSNSSEGRIERLQFYKDGWREGLCFSWWNGNTMVPRPLDGTDDEILLLFANAIQTKGVFSEHFSDALRNMLSGVRQYPSATQKLRRKTDYARELARASTILADGSEGRIEKLLFGKESWYEGQEGLRFSRWDDNHFFPGPLCVTEKELVALLEKALQQNVFPESFLTSLRSVLQSEQAPSEDSSA